MRVEVVEGGFVWNYYANQFKTATETKDLKRYLNKSLNAVHLEHDIEIYKTELKLIWGKI